jgi:predicted flavoprotein YhiN
MESRIVQGLFFCGEMMDVDGMTGGYNLQAAFSTGYLAGESAGKEQGKGLRYQVYTIDRCHP